MTFVLDSSAALAWVYPDELTPSLAQLSERVSETGAWVPTLWRLEIGNNLHLAARRGRINREQRDKILEDLEGLNIVTDADTQTFAWTTTLRLAERYRLTLYDACYLELAQRLQLPLATLDQDLRRAAGALGLELLGA